MHTTSELHIYSTWTCEFHQRYQNWVHAPPDCFSLAAAEDKPQVGQPIITTVGNVYRCRRPAIKETTCEQRDQRHIRPYHTIEPLCRSLQLCDTTPQPNDLPKAADWGQGWIGRLITDSEVCCRGVILCVVMYLGSSTGAEILNDTHLAAAIS